MVLCTFILLIRRDGSSMRSVTKETGEDMQVIRTQLGEGLKDIKAFDVSRQQGTRMSYNWLTSLLQYLCVCGGRLICI